MTPLIFVTGGVVSSLGKGIAPRPWRAILEARGLRVTMLKLDPYINVDPGTMSPFQHGEVYVTDDGAETDLDLGHYERFVRTRLTAQQRGHHRQDLRERDPQGTPRRLPRRHRAGDPAHHRRDQGAHRRGHRRLRRRPGRDRRHRGRHRIAAVPRGDPPDAHRARPEQALFMHLTLVPYIEAAGEIKTKPTQHSVKELRSIGIQPDVLLCRTEQPLPDSERRKIALFTNVPEKAVISAVDLDTIYEHPAVAAPAGPRRDRGRPAGPARRSRPTCPSGSAVVEAVRASARRGHHRHGRQVRRAQGCLQVAGRSAAPRRPAPAHARRPELARGRGHRDRRARGCWTASTASWCRAASAIAASRARCVTAKYARENSIPYFGICYGMQAAVVDFARNVAGLAGANSTENDRRPRIR